MYETSEAARFAEIAKQLGVPTGNVLIEPKATNIGENIRLTETLLQAGDKKVLFVTKPQTQLRLQLTLEKISTLDAYQVDAPPRTLDQAISLFGKQRILSEMVGDLDRLLQYPDYGYCAEVTMDDTVIEAWHLLCHSGYVDHLLGNRKPSGSS